MLLVPGGSCKRVLWAKPSRDPERVRPTSLGLRCFRGHWAFADELSRLSAVAAPLGG